MSEMTQAMCFLAGANSIFTGDKLLTAPNAGDDNDAAMFARLGLRAMAIAAPHQHTSLTLAAE
jgi:biotin synthase